MKKKMLITMAVAIFLAMPLGSVFAYEAFTGPTEVIRYDEDKAYNGYTLFSPFSTAGSTYTTYLMDMKGNIVHKWEGFANAPGLYAYLMENGHIMRGDRLSETEAADTYKVLSGPRCGRVEEYDWDGNLVWGVDHYSEDSISHHDFQRIYNKKLDAYTTIFLTFERMTAADAVALGVDPIYEDDYTGAGENKDGWSLDGIYEVDMTGTIVWKWSFAEHLCQDYDATKPDFGVISEMPGKLDINWLSPYGGPNPDWTHCNSLDYNEELDHFVLNAKHMSEFYVVDHGGTFEVNEAVPGTKAATDAGDFLYRFGNPSVYQQGDPPDYNYEGHHQMYASHDIQWIRDKHYTDGPALPGAGNFLIFDNGTWRPVQTHSSVIEIDPSYASATGYQNPPDAGYVSATVYAGATKNESNQVVWRYEAKNRHRFYGRHISGQTRMPNGNTVIMSGTEGHMFEVTEDKEIVWEYVNPVTKTGNLTTQGDEIGGNSTFRCYRYGLDYPAFAGKDLTSMGTITGQPAYAEEAVAPVTLTGWGLPPGGVSAEPGAAEAAEGGEGGY